MAMVTPVPKSSAILDMLGQSAVRPMLNAVPSEKVKSIAQKQGMAQIMKG